MSNNIEKLTGAERIQLGILEQLFFLNQTLLLTATIKLSDKPEIETDITQTLDTMTKIAKSSETSYKNINKNL